MSSFSLSNFLLFASYSINYKSTRSCSSLSYFVRAAYSLANKGCYCKYQHINILNI